LTLSTLIHLMTSPWLIVTLLALNPDAPICTVTVVAARLCAGDAARTATAMNGNSSLLMISFLPGRPTTVFAVFRRFQSGMHRLNGIRTSASQSVAAQKSGAACDA
jgi:hypothetical protein